MPIRFLPWLAAAVLLGATGAAKKPPLDLRIHTEGMAAEAPTFAFPATLLNGKPVHLARMPLLTQREVAAVYPFTAANGSEGAYLKLDNHGSGLLKQHTMNRRGGTLAVFLNGRQISNLLVDRPVTDGIVAIPRGLSAEDIQLLTSFFPVLGEDGKVQRR